MTATQGQAIGGMEILSKASAALDALADRGTLSIAELARVVGEPVSSTYRLVSNLVDLGWVDPSSRRGHYRLGLDFIRVGAAVEETTDIRAIAQPFLRDLRGRTAATSFLCIRRGLAAVCIDRLDGRDVGSLAMRLGDSLPLGLGAAPLALLALLPASERTLVIANLAREASARFPEYRFDSAAATRAVDETLRRGWAESDGDVTPGIAAIGMPVTNHRGEVVAAVSVSGMRGLILDDVESTVTAVRTAAHGITAMLGGAIPEER
ncbi:IclR family transcriptional regulator [Microbacterium yannicii]|uniref:IclR family transcriptional regulator n=1 Tax=Microbacterium yannicii TaxID=671622 RepID=UPI0002D9C407|nr:IclR family transcriptional regulator [Microbacterium yannicii]